jgi:hypothetical protein
MLFVVRLMEFYLIKALPLTRVPLLSHSVMNTNVEVCNIHSVYCSLWQQQEKSFLKLLSIPNSRDD